MILLCKLALDRHRFRSYGSPGAVLPPITWPVDQCEPVGVGLPFSGVHSGTVHKNTVSDEGRRHLGERRKERGEYLGEKGRAKKGGFAGSWL